jgi:hypothetical protein
LKKSLAKNPVRRFILRMGFFYCRAPLPLQASSLQKEGRGTIGKPPCGVLFGCFMQPIPCNRQKNMLH